MATITGHERQGSTGAALELETVDHFLFVFYEAKSKIHTPGQISIFRITPLMKHDTHVTNFQRH